MTETEGAYRVKFAGADSEIDFIVGATPDAARGSFATLADAKAAAADHLGEQQARIAEMIATLDTLGEADVARVEEEPPEPAEPEAAAGGYGGAYHVIFEDVDTRIQFWDDSEPMGEADHETFEAAQAAALEYLRWCLEDGGFHEEITEELPAAIKRVEALQESDVPR